MKTGILLHVYHLETRDWQRLIWGEPGSDELGLLPKFAEVMLSIPFDQEVASIVYSGPSSKDGFTEGGYTKHYLLQNLDRLAEFPRLQKKLDSLDEVSKATFKARLHNLEEGPVIKNTYEEVRYGAEHFKQQQADAVIQVAVASHAPRCLQNQLIVREEGGISSDQLWSVVASEVEFAQSVAKDLLILEMHHRGDDPMADVRPAMSQVLRPYLHLPTDQKKQLITAIQKAFDEL